MFRTMLFAADSQSTALGDRIPWDSYDRFMVIHAGSDFQSDLRGDSPLDIPSFTVGLERHGRGDLLHRLDHARDRSRHRSFPRPPTRTASTGRSNGVIAHENGHNCLRLRRHLRHRKWLPGRGALEPDGQRQPRRFARSGFRTATSSTPRDSCRRAWIRSSASSSATRSTSVEPALGETTTVRDVERHPDVSRVFLTSDEYLLHREPLDRRHRHRSRSTRTRPRA